MFDIRFKNLALVTAALVETKKKWEMESTELSSLFHNSRNIFSGINKFAPKSLASNSVFSHFPSLFNPSIIPSSSLSLCKK